MNTKKLEQEVTLGFCLEPTGPADDTEPNIARCWVFIPGRHRCPPRLAPARPPNPTGETDTPYKNYTHLDLLTANKVTNIFS